MLNGAGPPLIRRTDHKTMKHKNIPTSAPVIAAQTASLPQAVTRAVQMPAFYQRVRRGLELYNQCVAAIDNHKERSVSIIQKADRALLEAALNGRAGEIDAEAMQIFSAERSSKLLADHLESVRAELRGDVQRAVTGELPLLAKSHDEKMNVRGEMESAAKDGFKKHFGNSATVASWRDQGSIGKDVAHYARLVLGMVERFATETPEIFAA